MEGGNGFVLPADGATAGLDEIWKRIPKARPPRPAARRARASPTAANGLTLYASSEKPNAPLFMIKRK